MRPRPLSPHLGVYRFMYTMATSIAHRITGVVLSVGLVVLVGWLYAAASSADTYARASALLSSGWMLAFCYHLCNGIRHLNWDLGRGLEKAEARRSATLVVAVTVALAAAFIYAAFFAGVPR